MLYPASSVLPSMLGVSVPRGSTSTLHSSTVPVIRECSTVPVHSVSYNAISDLAIATEDYAMLYHLVGTCRSFRHIFLDQLYRLDIQSNDQSMALLYALEYDNTSTLRLILRFIPGLYARTPLLWLCGIEV